MKSVVLALLVGLSLNAQAEEKVLNIYNWADYIGPQALKTFQAETGIKINYDSFDSAEVLETKLLTGNSGYDLIFPGIAMVSRGIQAKALQPTGLSGMQGFDNLDKELLEEMQANDPGNIFAAPYTWGTLGLLINRQEVEKRIPNAPLDSLDLLFKPEYSDRLKDCGIALIDSPQEVVSVALNYLGRSPYSADPKDLDAVRDLFKKLRPNVRYIGFGTQNNDMSNGNLCLAFGYSGDAITAQTQAKAANKPFEVLYQIPREGTMRWVDTMAIPVDAPHPLAAKKFIEFMLRPEPMAEVSNTVFYATGNEAATPLVDKEILQNPGIYPSELMRANFFQDKSLPARQLRERTRIWSVLRSR